METNTISQIRSSKVDISESIETYKAFMKNQPNIDLNLGQFGNESEYCINGLIGGVKNILTDISYLVKSHAFYIKISTYIERVNIQNELESLNTYIQNRNHAKIASSIDSIKTILRGYNLRLDKVRFLDFNNETDNLQRKAIELDDDITTTKNKIKESTQIFEEIKDSKNSFLNILAELLKEKEELENTVELFKSKYESFDQLAETATENESIIKTKLTEVRESEAQFNAFIQKISTREAQLTKQGEKFSEYDKTLSEYKKKQEQILNEANDLIQKSLQALQYSTTEGISTAFSNQYSNANKPLRTTSWLVGAGVFLTLTLLLGVWILTGWGLDKNIDPIISIIGRLSLIPITLLASLFCANQFIKQRNIIEDYAYKTVLSKSMIAFSEELRTKDNGSYTSYLSTVLSEIHQDPLRKRGKEKDEVGMKDAAGLLDKIIDLVKITTKA